MMRRDGSLPLRVAARGGAVSLLLALVALAPLGIPALAAAAEEVTFVWEENTDPVSGYRLYAREAYSDAYRMIWEGGENRHTVPLLLAGCAKKRLFTVRAFNGGAESGNSNVVELGGACVDFPDVGIQGFDKAGYLAQKLAHLAKLDPDWEGKDPAFLEGWWLSVGMRPVDDYKVNGHREGLSPNRLFNHREYRAAVARAMHAAGEFGTLEEARAAFRAAWPGDAYRHYLQYGAAAGIDPSNGFDESAYLANQLAAYRRVDPDWNALSVDDLRAWLISVNLTPLTHYIHYGAHEGIAAPPVPPGERVTPDDKP